MCSTLVSYCFAAAAPTLGWKTCCAKHHLQNSFYCRMENDVPAAALPVPKPGRNNRTAGDQAIRSWGLIEVLYDRNKKVIMHCTRDMPCSPIYSTAAAHLTLLQLPLPIKAPEALGPRVGEEESVWLSLPTEFHRRTHNQHSDRLVPWDHGCLLAVLRAASFQCLMAGNCLPVLHPLHQSCRTVCLAWVLQLHLL